MADSLSPRLLVTGAGGHLGGRVVALLRAAGAAHVVAASRDPAKLAMAGVETRRADFDDPASLDAAFAGIDRLLIISTDAISVPGQRLRQHEAAVAAAVRAGVKHILYTSMPNPEPPSPLPIAPDHYGTEQAIAASGLGFTILRNSWYAENLLGALPQVLASGKWVTAAGEGRTPYVAREDAARAAAAALASGAAENRRYDIAGPEALTTAEIAGIVGDVCGKPIEVVQLPPDALAAALVAAGIPAPLVPFLVAADAAARAGKFDVPLGAVKQLTGHEPQSLRDFLMAHRPMLMGA